VDVVSGLIDSWCFSQTVPRFAM